MHIIQASFPVVSTEALPQRFEKPVIIWRI